MEKTDPAEPIHPHVSDLWQTIQELDGISTQECSVSQEETLGSIVLSLRHTHLCFNTAGEGIGCRCGQREQHKQAHGGNAKLIFREIAICCAP